MSTVAARARAPAPLSPTIEPALSTVLRGVRLFSSLAPGALEEIARRGVARTLSRRTILFRKGERCRGLHVVLEGRVEIYASARDGREQVLHRIGARQAVTQLPLFDGSGYPASARAATECRVFFVSAEVVERLCFDDPALLRLVIGDLGRSVRRLTRLVEKVSLKDVHARVATALLEQAAAAGVPSPAHFQLAVTQEQMAAALGVARESVARALSALRRAGIIEQHGRDVHVLDPARLSAVAEGSSVRAALHAAPSAGNTGYALPLDGPCC